MKRRSVYQDFVRQECAIIRQRLGLDLQKEFRSMVPYATYRSIDTTQKTVYLKLTRDSFAALYEHSPRFRTAVRLYHSQGVTGTT